MRTLAFVFLLLTVPRLAAPAHAQNALDEAKAQYEAAAYEEALATLTRLDDADTPVDRVEVEQYRALCLIALGNMSDAERAVAALVAADPTYVPSPTVASPKVLSVVAEIRKKELPGAARRLLDTGRTAFQANNLAGARQQFDLLLQLLDDPAMADRPEKEDLRILAQGFVTLATAASTVPLANPAAPVREDGASSATPLPASSAARPVALTEAFVPATPIDQRLPEWEPPSASIALFEYKGRLRVRIGVDGKVTAVTIEAPSHPLYDARLLQVAYNWRYKPATLNGVPLESERVIAISLRAQP